MLDWQHRYNPEKLELGMVNREDFVDVNNHKYFGKMVQCVETLERHIGERLPEDFRKYLIYCGHMFYDWCAYGIELWKWNDEDETDQTKYCMFCNQALEGTVCNASDFKMCFSHEGCGFFRFITVKGPEKGTIWNANPNYSEPDPYLNRCEKTFIEILNRIYNVPSKAPGLTDE